MSETSGVVAIHRSLRAAFRFVYDHSFALVGVSLAWSLLSLPLVTIGPTTIGAYAAIESLRERGWIDKSEVYATVRRELAQAFLLSVVTGIIAVMGVLYTLRFVATEEPIAGILAVAAVYVAAHLALVLPAALLGLVRGVSLDNTLWTGYRWSVTNPVTAVLLGTTTLMLFIVSLLLTIAVILVFPAILFSFHVELLDDVVATTETAGSVDEVTVEAG